MSAKPPIPSPLLNLPKQGIDLEHPSGQVDNDDISLFVSLSQKNSALTSIFKEYNETAASADEMIFRINDEGHFIYVSPAFEKSLGYSTHDILGKHFSEIVYTDDLNSYPESFYALLKFGKTQNNLAFRVKHKQGQYVWMDCPAACLFDKEIKRGRLIALEKETLEINARPAVSLKLIVDYFLKGLEHIFPEMVCSVITLQEDMRVSYLSAPSLPESYAAVINDTPFEDNIGSCGMAMRRKQNIFTADIDNDSRWESLRQLAAQYQLKACWSFPILDANNEALAAIAVYHKEVKSPSENEIAVFERVQNLLRIVIENKKAEAEVRLSNERYMLATKATNDAVWDWDLAKNNLFWGEGFYLHFGFNPDTIRGSFSFWTDCIHEEDRQKVCSSLMAFVENKKTGLWQEEYRFRNAKGSYVLVFDRGFLVFNEVGEAVRMIGSMQDITDKRDREKKLWQEEFDRQMLAAQAVVDAQEKERADIGNELQDNVSQILSTARLYLELSKNVGSESLALINKSIENITAAINEIRNISHSLVPASIRDIGLVACIEDFAQDIRLTRAVNVAFHSLGDVEEIVDDKRKLVIFRIIQEQVANMLKYADAKNLTIELLVDDQGINLSISDDGKVIGKAMYKMEMSLDNIRRRAELFNGKISMLAGSKKGRKLKIYIPV